ncbi:hypothetical protein EDB89DRAFT_2074137 [Lactarius sanguifluus]|nr:hypothetical protein EDB89DRAFT_2074137 [Lactarius sanguifluus]
MSGEPSGSVGYLACYKKAMKVIEEGLDEETQVEYRVEAKKWAEQEAPPQQQQRYDNNDELGRTSFKAQYKGWLHDPMVEEFSRWTAESFGDHPANSSEEHIIKKDQTPKVKPLIDKHGYPVLPNWETIDHGGLIYKKMVIGQFMSKMYGNAAGGGKRRVPWAKLHEAQGDWIAAEYLLEGVTLTQYHHICLDNANSLLKHWIQRQAAGEIPFHFKKVDKADQHHDGLTLTRVPMASSLVENCRCWKMREFCPHTHPTPHLCPLALTLSLALSHSATLMPAVQGWVLPRNAPLTTKQLLISPLQAPEN